jgi:hypothetical protein
MSLYVNWKLVISTPLSQGNGIGNEFQDLWIWWNAKNWNHRFNWIIDDVRIYNRALTDSEIQVLYNATK